MNFPTRIFSRPNLFIVFGRPGSFKTAFSIWSASTIHGGRKYIGIGKHYTLCNSLDSCVPINDVEKLLRTLLEIVDTPPDVLVVDGVEALLFPLWSINRRAALQLFLFTIATLKKAARNGCRCIVTLEGGERPHFYSILGRLRGVVLLRLSVADTLLVDLLDTDLSLLSRYRIPIEELQGVYSGGSKG